MTRTMMIGMVLDSKADDCLKSCAKYPRNECIIDFIDHTSLPTIYKAGSILLSQVVFPSRQAMSCSNLQHI